MDHGILNIPLAKRGDIDAQIDSYKADQAADSKRASKAHAGTMRDLRARAKSIVENMTAERVCELADKCNTTPANVRNLMRSNAFWKPELVIKAQGGAA